MQIYRKGGLQVDVSDFDYTNCFEVIYQNNIHGFEQEIIAKIVPVDGCMDREQVDEIEIQIDVKDENTEINHPDLSTSYITIRYDFT